MILLRIFRFNAETRQEKYRLYKIETSRTITLYSTLEYIYENLDGSLGFRRYQCHMGWCNSCMVILNGKKVRSCSTLLKSGDEVKVGPLRGYKVIRDLVVDFSDKIRPS